MSEKDIKFKLIRADFMVAKSHLEGMTEKIEKEARKGKRLTKSHIVRQALDQYFMKEETTNLLLPSLAPGGQNPTRKFINPK